MLKIHKSSIRFGIVSLLEESYGAFHHPAFDRISPADVSAIFEEI
jgi:hypothetical protein